MFFAEALFFLLAAKTMLLLFPFRICIRTLSRSKYSLQVPQETLLLVRHSVARANKLAWWKNVCLVQAFAARWMLQRRQIDSSLMIGIRKEPQKNMTAHAWLMAGQQEIVSDANDYFPIMKY